MSYLGPIRSILPQGVPSSQGMPLQNPGINPLDLYKVYNQTAGNALSLLAGTVGAMTGAVTGRQRLNHSVLLRPTEQPEMFSGLPGQFHVAPEGVTHDPMALRAEGASLVGSSMLPWVVPNIMNLLVDGALLKSLRGSTDPESKMQRQIIALDALAIGTLLVDTLWSAGAYHYVGQGGDESLANTLLSAGRVMDVAGYLLMVVKSTMVLRHEVKKHRETHQTFTSSVVNFSSHATLYLSSAAESSYFLMKSAATESPVVANDILMGSTDIPSPILGAMILTKVVGASFGLMYSINCFRKDGNDLGRSASSRRGIKIASALGVAASSGFLLSALLVHPVLQIFAPIVMVGTYTLLVGQSLFDFRKVLKMKDLFRPAVTG